MSKHATEQTNPADTSTMTYEQAKNELHQIVNALESGSIPLEDTLNLWQRGEQLVERCKSILDVASAQIDASELATSRSADMFTEC